MILRRMLGHERRGVAEDYAAWERGMGLSARTTAGVVVTDDTALTVATVWAAIRIIAEDVAKLPLHLYQRDGRRRRLVNDHPLAAVLAQTANPEMTAMEMREALTAHAVGRGNAYAWPERDSDGRVVALWPLNPGRMQIVRVGSERRLWYLYTPEDGPARRFRWSELFHLRGLASDGIVGYSPIALARESIGLAKALEQHAAAFFGRGAYPGVVLIHPGELGSEAMERLRQSWNEAHQGLERAHAAAVLEEGMKVETLGFSAQDAQLVESGQFRVTELCRWFRMPPHKVADLTRATFSNIEHQSLEYVGDTLQPWLVRWEQRIGLSLLTELERARGYYARHNIEGLLRADAKSRAEYLKALREMGVYTPNRILELLDEDPIEDERGEELIRPGNMVPVGTPAPVRGDAQQRALETLLASAVRRGLRRLQEAGDHAGRREAAVIYAIDQVTPALEAMGVPALAGSVLRAAMAAGAEDAEAGVQAAMTVVTQEAV